MRPRRRLPPIDHDPRDVLRLALAAECDPRTARAWLAGWEPRPHILRLRLDDAARELGLLRAPRAA